MRSQLERSGGQWLALGFDDSYFASDPLIAAEASGFYFRDRKGRWFLDALCGQSAAVIGHNHPRVVEAIREQAGRMASNVGGTLPSERSIALAGRLAELTGHALTRTLFTVGGSDAVDTAIKAVRHYWRNVGEGAKFKTIVRRHGYHGGTLAANAASGNYRYPHSAYEPLPSGFVHVDSPYRYRCHRCAGRAECGLGCAEVVREAIEYEGPETVACVLAEPTMAASGIIPPPPGYLSRLREICDEHRVLLVLDEAVTAMGRAGAWFEFQVEGFIPDVVVLAKVLTGGHMPLGAVMARDAIVETFQGAASRRFTGGFTLAGTPLSCAAALATIDAISDEGLIERGSDLAAPVRDRLIALQRSSSVVGDVRTRGVMMAIELVANLELRRPFEAPGEVKARVVEVGRGEGVHFFGGPDSVVLWIPPLNATSGELDQLLSAVEKAVRAVEREFGGAAAAGC